MLQTKALPAHTVLSFPKVSNDHLLIERMALVAPMPLFATRIFLMAWSPKENCTKSSTDLKKPASVNGGTGTFLVVIVNTVKCGFVF